MANIKIPDGMLDAAYRRAAISLDTSDLRNKNGIELAVEAAVQWLSENPIKPTDKQEKYMFDWMQQTGGREDWECLIEWQRRMFIPHDPTIIPEEIQDLLPLTLDNSYVEIAIEAFRRGQKVGQK